MVRLKVFNPVIVIHLISDFNSSMVRLKGHHDFCERSRDSEFQFQYGAIEGFSGDNVLARVNRFQFQYGAIEGKYLSESIKWATDISIPVWCD